MFGLTEFCCNLKAQASTIWNYKRIQFFLAQLHALLIMFPYSSKTFYFTIDQQSTIHVFFLVYKNTENLPLFPPSRQFCISQQTVDYSTFDMLYSSQDSLVKTHILMVKYSDYEKTTVVIEDHGIMLYILHIYPRKMNTCIIHVYKIL